MRHALLALAALALLLSACGPSVSVMTMRPSAARESGCSLDFVEVDMTRVEVDKEWTLLGYVTLSETGVQDPFSERYRAIVRPKACQLGGTAVALGMSSASQGMMGAGSGTVYAVLKPYAEPSSETTSF